jgi:hypothetical protein
MYAFGELDDRIWAAGKKWRKACTTNTVLVDIAATDGLLNIALLPRSHDWRSNPPNVEWILERWDWDRVAIHLLRDGAPFKEQSRKATAKKLWPMPSWPPQHEQRNTTIRKWIATRTMSKSEAVLLSRIGGLSYESDLDLDMTSPINDQPQEEPEPRTDITIHEPGTHIKKKIKFASWESPNTPKGV